MKIDSARTEAIASGGLAARLPIAILMAGLIIAGGLLIEITPNLAFYADEWNLLILRPGWGLNQFLDHFNGHPIMAPALIYKLVQEVIGMESARPVQLIAIGTFLLMNALLFIYLRRRVGDWAALIGTFLILFLGAAFEDLLWAFQVGFFGSLAAGIGALIALDREDREGDIAASILFFVSITFSSIGLAFIAAAVIEWILNPRDRRERWFVPGASVIFYAIWWIGWGSQDSTTSMDPAFSMSVIPKVPGYVFDAFSAGLVSLAGLATGDGSEPDQPNLIWGQIGAIALVGLGIWRLRVLGRPPRDFLVAGAGLLALLILFALGQNEMRAATSSRYQLPIAVLIVLTAACLLRGIEIRRWALAAAGFLAVLAISSGVDLMASKAEERWQPTHVYTRSTLSGIEAAGPDAAPGYRFKVATGFDIPADQYLEAVDAFGSPAFPLPEMRAGDSSKRASFDLALIEAMGVTVNGFPPPLIESSCRSAEADQTIEVDPGSYVIVNRGESELFASAARLSDPPGKSIGGMFPKAKAGIELPGGAINDPWTLSFSGAGPVEVCRAK